MQALKRWGLRLRRTWVVPAVVFAAASPSADPRFRSGDELMELCKGTDIGEPATNIPQYNDCVSYLMGLNDAESTFVGWKDKTPDFCLPNNTSSEQLRQVFLRWMAEHPETRHFNAGSVAINAFREAWPCAD